LEETAADVFEVPLSLGTVGHLAEQTSAALAPAHALALQAVRAAAVKNVAETGGKRAGGCCWLWAAATATVAAFAIHARRSAAGRRALLGDVRSGIVGSDRWSVYQKVAPDCWQVWWAHLKRDFQAMVDRDNAGAAIGANWLLQTGVLFEWWHRVRDGRLSRRTFRRYVAERRAARGRPGHAGAGERLPLREDGGDVSRVVGGGGIAGDVRARRGGGTDQ
jgi:transposase